MKLYFLFCSLFSILEMETITTENRNTVDRENELRNKQHRNQQSHEDL